MTNYNNLKEDCTANNGAHEMLETENLSLILRAMKFAATKHRVHRRKDKEKSAYINHPIAVAEMLHTVGGISHVPTLVAAILHDTVEDVGATFDEIKAEFGEEVLSIMREVTDDKNLSTAEIIRIGIETAPNKSLGARQIKIADKISNIYDMTHTPPHKWSLERKQEYLYWTEELISRLRGTNEELERLYDETVAECRATLMTDLEKSILLATKAHAGQRDKSEAPYILHPLRVMLQTLTEAETMAAVLHDTVEDTKLTLEDLRREGLPPHVIEAVDCLTKREGEPYEDFIKRVKTNRIARNVKLADLKDNLDVTRLDQISEKDAERLNRYLRVRRELLKSTEIEREREWREKEAARKKAIKDQESEANRSSRGSESKEPTQREPRGRDEMDALTRFALAGQTRNGGKLRKWVHCRNVALRLDETLRETGEAGSEELEQIVLAGFGHDLYEDSEITSEQVAVWFGSEVDKLIESVTNRFGDAYPEEYSRHLETISEAGKLIKLADLLDNLSSSTEALADNGVDWTRHFLLPIVGPQWNRLRHMTFREYPQAGELLRARVREAWRGLHQAMNESNLAVTT